MMKYLFVIALFVLPRLCIAQQKDSVIIADSSGTIVPVAITKADTVAKAKTARKFSPRAAAIRSAILPGLGQVYNKKYWKVPIVYTAVGIPVYLFFYNKNWYNRTRYALAVVANNTTDPDSLNRVHQALRPLVDDKQQQRLIGYRNDFRKDMDYSVLFTLLFWGLNIVDATVDAHLKGFNVSDDLSMRVRPSVMPGGSGAGLSLVFTFNAKPKNSFRF